MLYIVLYENYYPPFVYKLHTPRIQRAIATTFPEQDITAGVIDIDSEKCACPEAVYMTIWKDFVASLLHSRASLG